MNVKIKKIRIFGPHSQEGAALVIAVMILLILTVIGIYAVTTSTLETKIAGSERVLQDAFYAADGGTDYGRRVIELVLGNRGLPKGANDYADNGTTLQEEILGDTKSGWQIRSPWVAPTIGQCTMEIHIDRLKAVQPEGESAVFGEPASEKKITIYYRTSSTSSGIAGASSQVQTIYRRLVQ